MKGGNCETRRFVEGDGSGIRIRCLRFIDIRSERAASESLLEPRGAKAGYLVM